MHKLISHFKAWVLTSRGATAIEYGLIAAAIAVAISAVVFAFGDELGELFGNAATAVAERP